MHFPLAAACTHSQKEISVRKYMTPRLFVILICSAIVLGAPATALSRDKYYYCRAIAHTYPHPDYWSDVFLQEQRTSISNLDAVWANYLVQHERFFRKGADVSYVLYKNFHDGEDEDVYQVGCVFAAETEQGAKDKKKEDQKRFASDKFVETGWSADQD